MFKKIIFATLATAALAWGGASVAEAGHGCYGPGYGHSHRHHGYYHGWGLQPGYGYSSVRAYYGPGVSYRSYRPYYGPGYYGGYYPARSGVSFSIGF